MVNKKSLSTFVRTLGNQAIAGFKHFLNNVKIGGDLIHDPDPLGSTATNLLTVDAQGVVRKATSLAGVTGTVTSVAITAPSAFTVTGSPITSSGTIAIGAAGTAAQYVRGDGSLQTFPSLTGFVPYVGATANVNLGTHTLLSRDIVINHPSGSGIAASITKNGSGAAVSIIKDGSGEGLTVVKGSGSGNAASITGGVTLISELHVSGESRIDGNIVTGYGSNSEYSLTMGQNRTGNGFSYIDLIGDTTYTDYGLRMIRFNAGANAESQIVHRGTGLLSIGTIDAAPFAIKTIDSTRLYVTASGDVGIGTTSPSKKLDVNGGGKFSGSLEVQNTAEPYNQFKLRDSFTPSSSGDTSGAQGNFAWDDNFIYLKTSSGWKRATIDAF
jgi:hypothetical protein